MYQAGYPLPYGQGQFIAARGGLPSTAFPMPSALGPTFSQPHTIPSHDIGFNQQSLAALPRSAPFPTTALPPEILRAGLQPEHHVPAAIVRENCSPRTKLPVQRFFFLLRPPFVE